MLAASRKSLLSSLVLGALLVCLAPARCHAWGDTAHRIIARIAFQRLTPEARARALELLAGEDFVSASTYADAIRVARPDSAGWHFVDIPAGAPTYVAQRDCVGGDCLVAATERFERVLGGQTVEKGVTRAEALKFLIHLVGDLSQPFHCYDNDDKGANLVRVMVKGRQTSLHAAWDTYLLELAMEDPVRLEDVRDIFRQLKSPEEAFAARLSEAAGSSGSLLKRYPSLTLREVEYWAAGTPAEWAEDSHRVAVAVADTKLAFATPQQQRPAPQPARKMPFPLKKKAGLADDGQDFYLLLPLAQRKGMPAQNAPSTTDARTPELYPAYYKATSQTLEQQLIKAGLRLARVLNEILAAGAPAKS
jgi:S1/P1 Nuclease